MRRYLPASLDISYESGNARPSVLERSAPVSPIKTRLVNGSAVLARQGGSGSARLIRESVLTLQRTCGNRAAAKLVQRQFSPEQPTPEAESHGVELEGQSSN